MPEVQTPEPKVASMLVTSENRAEFMTKRMDLKAPPEAAPVVVAPAPEVKAVPETPKPEVKAPPVEEVKTLEADLKAEEAKAQPDEKKKQTIRERISEITEQKKKAQEATQQALARADKAEREAAELRTRLAAPPPPPADEGDLKAPVRAEFTSDEAYQDARVDYRVKIARAEERKAEADARAKDESARVVSTYSERLRATKAETPDFDARIEKAANLQIAPHIRDAIYESEVGPKMTLYFADNQEEAKRINALSPNAALREFGKIEAMLESAAKPAPKAATPAAPKVEISSAPAPIVPIKAIGIGEAEPKLDTAGNFRGTYAEWKAMRKAGKLK